MSEFDRLFKVSVCHNISESFDLHDICRVLLIRMLRRKHPNCKIYSEYHPTRTNECYPDIFMQIGKDNYVFEVQKIINEDWVKDMMEKYSEETLIIVPLRKIRDSMHLKKTGDFVENLKEILNEYVI